MSRHDYDTREHVYVINRYLPIFRFFGVIAFIFVAGLPALSVDLLPGAPHFDRISRSDGLSNASVSSIFQDRRGFMWFGTQGGLNRFDGRNVRVWEHDPFDENSLPHNLIQTMYLDPKEDVIWIGTYRGLSRFEMTTERFENYVHHDSDPTSLSDDVVTAIARDTHGFIWVGTLDGLNRLDPKTGAVERVGSSGALPHQTIRALHVDGDGMLWVGSYGGLSVVDTESLSVVRTLSEADGLPAPAVMSIHPTGGEALWLGVWGGGLTRYDPQSDGMRTYELADDRVYVVNGTDTIYAGTWGGGLFGLDTETGSIRRYVHDPRRDASLSHNVVYSLAFDTAGALWVGTNGNGVNRRSEHKRNRLRFRHDLADPESLSPGKITAIHRDSRGVLWIGTYTGGLNRWSPSEGRMVHYSHNPGDPHSLSNDIVTSIFEDSRGRLWVTTNEGLNLYDSERDRFERMYHDPEDPNTIPDNITYCMAEDAEGMLWVGTYSAGVSRFDPADGTFSHYSNDPSDPESLSDDLVYAMLVDSSGRLWIGTNNGLNLYRPDIDGFVRFVHDSGDRSTLSGNTVRVLHEGGNGDIWIGTVSGGLNRLDVERMRFAHLTKRDGLPDNTVIGILEDGYSRLWLATLYGISVVDRDMTVVRNLDEEDGLAGMEFNGGHFRDTDGTLLFGGPEGVSVFTDQLLGQNVHKPPVHIIGVEVDGVSVESAVGSETSVSLSYRNASLSVEYVALDYEAPGKNTYRYKLIGFDAGWTDSGRRNFTTYTNLPAGTYTFVVQGANNDGVWGAVPATLQVSVQASPWLRWWSFLAYGVIAVAVYALLLRIREGRVLRVRERQLAATRERLRAANQRLETLSVEDDLTGLYNRKYLNARLEEEYVRARRGGSPLSLLIVDIDRFAAFNDAYGRAAGDECLKVVAETLRDEVNRLADFVARFDGEEFCIVLPQTETDGAGAVAERVRKAVRSRSIAHATSDVDECVTVSIGACTWNVEGVLGVESIVSAAEGALYRAKEGGRNRVESCTVS